MARADPDGPMRAQRRYLRAVSREVQAGGCLGMFGEYIHMYIYIYIFWFTALGFQKKFRLSVFGFRVSGSRISGLGLGGFSAF